MAALPGGGGTGAAELGRKRGGGGWAAVESHARSARRSEGRSGGEEGEPENLRATSEGEGLSSRHGSCGERGGGLLPRDKRAERRGGAPIGTAPPMRLSLPPWRKWRCGFRERALWRGEGRRLSTVPGGKNSSAEEEEVAEADLAAPSPLLSALATPGTFFWGGGGIWQRLAAAGPKGAAVLTEPCPELQSP